MSLTGYEEKGKDRTIFESPTFEKDIRIRVNEAIGSASIAPNGRDVVLASQQGLHIIDLDAPYSPPRHLRHETPWTPADVQWSPFAQRYYWVASTSNQRALVWNLELGGSQAPIEHVLHAHSRAITDINFSAHHPDILATCAVDSFVHCWDLRTPSRPAVSFSDWFAGATQVKWNRQDSHVVASAHDRFLRIWDDRKGATPLTTIEAHGTKIYGVDWDRSSPTKLITCSLDRTIKTWDYSVSDILPERIIQTPFPVWRARHTPFGCGVLAMPQRGDNNVHLYDRRMDDSTQWHAETEPVHSFKGHRNHVKEFLWRARGNISQGTDERDFQLITWGADQELILHRMRDKYMKPVGFEKGMVLKESWPLTRRGAPYKTFRDVPIMPGDMLSQRLDAEQGAGFAMDVFQGNGSPGMSRAPIPMARNWLDGPKMMSHSGMKARNGKKQDNNLITWMKGVKFGKRKSDRRRSRPSFPADPSGAGAHIKPESLSDEIVNAGTIFKKVEFEELDLSARRLRVSLTGPWGLDDRPVYLQLNMHFPEDYPERSAPQFHLERLSSIADGHLSQLEADLSAIASAYLVHKLRSFEACLSYLLGEIDLHQSIGWLADDGEVAVETVDKVDSSSDEEDALGELAGTGSQTLEADGAIGSGIISSNANVPLPKACGALWAPDGRLVCFFPPKEEPPSLLDQVGLDGRSKTKSAMFEGFGRLHADSPEPKSQTIDDSESGEDSESDHFSSSSSSSESEDGILFPPARFFPPKAWRGASMRLKKIRSRSTEGSQRTSAIQGHPKTSTKDKTVVSLYRVDDLLPAKRALAEDYQVFGDGPSVCAHNSAAAARHGYEDLSDIWKYIRLVLCNEVPLSITSLARHQDDVFVLAKRALVVIKKKDSGLDLSFDEPESVTKAVYKGHVKWGNHPLGRTWLVRSLFDHFERAADVQMLAMISCIFAERAELESDFFQERDQLLDNLCDSMRWPGQSLGYLPSSEVALSMQKPIISISASPRRSQTLSSTFGSSGSFEGYRDSNQPPSEPPTPFDFDSTPPLALSRASTQRSSAAQSLSTSPEQRMFAPSATSSFAQSVWSRPFNLQSSPPQRNRLSGEENILNSIPSSSGVTWGPVTVHRSNSTIRRSFLAQELATKNDGGSTTEEDEPVTPELAVKVTLKNQLMFDDEAHPGISLLDAGDATKHTAYREAYAHILDVWGLSMQQHEILKFNGRSIDASPHKLSDASSQTTLTIGKADQTEKIALHEQSLLVSRCCANCGRAESTSGAAVRCSGCTASPRLMQCSICSQPISTLYKACLICGHTTHVSCLRLLLASSDEYELDCEAVCGCSCIDHTLTEVDPISPALSRASSKVAHSLAVA